MSAAEKRVESAGASSTERGIKRRESSTLTGLAVLGGGEAHLALAAVPAGRVQALAVLAQVHVVRALIHVCKSATLLRVKRLWKSHPQIQLSIPEQEKPSPTKPSLQAHL